MRISHGRTGDTCQSGSRVKYMLGDEHEDRFQPAGSTSDPKTFELSAEIYDLFFNIMNIYTPEDHAAIEAWDNSKGDRDEEVMIIMNQVLGE